MQFTWQIWSLRILAVWAWVTLSRETYCMYDVFSVTFRAATWVENELWMSQRKQTYSVIHRVNMWMQWAGGRFFWRSDTRADGRVVRGSSSETPSTSIWCFEKQFSTQYSVKRWKLSCNVSVICLSVQHKCVKGTLLFNCNCSNSCGFYSETAEQAAPRGSACMFSITLSDVTANGFLVEFSLG